MTTNHCDDEGQRAFEAAVDVLLDDSFDDGDDAAIDEVLEQLRVILLGGEG